MKKLIILISIIILSTLNIFAQRHIRTNSQIDWSRSVIDGSGSVYPDIQFDIYMKRALQKDYSGPKLAYWRSGIFKTDSIVGIRFGYDFDLMAEMFEKSNGNTFRHWNRFRMGFHFILKNNVYHPLIINDAFDIIDAELTVSYLHIPSHMRGDQTLSRRRGYIEMFFSLRSSFDKNAYIGVKPFGAMWLRATYQDVHYLRVANHRFVGLDIEILTNKNGYKNGMTKLTKDYYKGFSFVVGGKYDMITKSPYINLGIRVYTRNH